MDGPALHGPGPDAWGRSRRGWKGSERQEAYACDITYGTNNEFGFDYLRDNMRLAARGDNRYPKSMQQARARCISRSSTKSTTS